MTESRNGIDQLPRSWGLYMIVNRHTGRIYVGQASNVRTRCGAHLAQLRAGYHPNYKMQHDATLHGADKFVCAALVGDSEPAMIEALGAADVDTGYNLTHFASWTKETRFRHHESWLVERALYSMLPGATWRSPVSQTLVATWLPWSE